MGLNTQQSKLVSRLKNGSLLALFLFKNLPMAWFAGLLLDVSYGTLMGQHAIGMVLVIYVIHLQHQRLRVASLLQQAIVIFFLLLLKQLLILWVNGMLGHAPGIGLYFMPTFTSTLLWPWTYLILRDIRRKFSIDKHETY